MHRCLHVPEIVELICQEGFYNSNKASRSAILALARTCRVLYEPAANTIWHRIETLKPLLNCVSKEIWDNLVDDSVVLKPLRASDIARLRRLANRVREFGYESAMFDAQYMATDFPTREDIQPQYYQALSAASGFIPLLQNVLRIRLVDPSLTMLYHVNLFTNPQITVFQMICPSIDDTPRPFRLQLAAFLGSLRERYPSLEDISIRLFPIDDDDPLAAAVENALCSCQWNRLSHLMITSPCSAGLLNYLLECPSLRFINIMVSLEETDLPPVERGSISRPFLPLLEEMTLLIPRIPITLDFLGLLLPRPQPNPLRTARFYSNTPEFATTEQWTTLIQCISKLCLNPNGSSHLTTLNLDDSLVDLDEISNLAVDHQFTISLVDSPLFKFQHLVTVNIVTFGILEINDDVLATLAHSWSRIRVLQLMGQHPLNLPPKVTINGLAALADLCPSLADLSIDFSANTLQASRPGTRPKYGRALRALNVMRSTVTKPSLTAAMLADFFPRIKAFEWEEEHADLWEQVEDLYPAFVLARSDEIARSKLPCKTRTGNKRNTS